MNDSAPLPAGSSEWLETDGMGGFASGTVGGWRSRRYHALLQVALRPPAQRMVLVNGFDAEVCTESRTWAISSQRYTPDVTHPDGRGRLIKFTPEPWPSWTFENVDGVRVRQEIFVPKGRSVTIVTWSAEEAAGPMELAVRPFLSGRDFHSFHHENPHFRMSAEVTGQRVLWNPYDGGPRIASFANGVYSHAPQWYRNFQHDEERERGLDFCEDLVCPGVLRWDLSRGEAFWLIGTPGELARVVDGEGSLEHAVRRIRDLERARRRALGTPEDRAADTYLVRGTYGGTLIAGYPWFGDWGRDTFIALRGLCLARGDWEAAREILLAWAGHVSRGMLPNRFPDDGGAPEFNSVDAALWYVIAVHEYLYGSVDASLSGLTVSANAEGGKRGRRSPIDHDPRSVEKKVLHRATESIIEGYANGTRHGIRADADGLLACGEPGFQLTWMDVKIGDWVVTPRVGKPVEIQALWINALRIVSSWQPKWGALHDRALATFQVRFWDASRGCLYDVIDVDHEPGKTDSRLRPNQIFAVGGLPYPLIEGERARAVVKKVEEHLLTPVGLRSLAPGEPGYRPRYEGDPRSRDSAYHEGTVWPWLIGAFVEAWVRSEGGNADARLRARERFLPSLRQHMASAGLGHISEILDGDAPHAPRGCPFQAWSLGEFLRLDRVVLAPVASKSV